MQRLTFILLLLVACNPPAPDASSQIRPAIGYPRPPGGGGGSGDITSVAVTSPIAGGGTSGDVTISLSSTGCSTGEVWTWNGSAFACDPVGDLTAVTASAPLAVATGTGPVPALSLSGTGCEQGATQVWDGSAWTCTNPHDTSGMDWSCEDEMTGPPYGAAVGTCGVAALSGGTIAANGVTDVTHPGSQLWTIDTATDRSTLVSNGSAIDTIVFAAGANNYFEAILQFNLLSTGTDTYTLRVGFCDVINADCVDGAYFELNSNADGQFQCKTASNSARTTASPDSAVTAAATTWYKLRVEVDGSSAVRFYINGSQVCTHDQTNIPSGAARATQAMISYIASAGTASRTLSLDRLAYGGYFTAGGR